MPTELTEAEELSSPRVRVFIQEYLVDLNATQAAIRAGYSAKTARQAASRLLSNVNVQYLIKKGMEERETRLKITQDRVLLEFARLAFSDMRRVARWGASGVDFKESEELSEEDSACIKEVSETTNEHGGSLKIRLHDKLNALVWVAKHLGIDEAKTSDPLEGMRDDEKIRALEGALVFMKGRLEGK